MTAAPQSSSSGTEQPLAWHCCDDRYPWIKDIVTTSPTTIDAWRDGGIKFQPLYPRGNAQPSLDALAGLDERLDRLLLTSNENDRFVLSTESAKNIVGIVREWIRTRDIAQGSIDRGEIGALESNPVLFDILNNALGTMHYHRLMSALNWNGYQIVASPPAALPAADVAPITMDDIRLMAGEGKLSAHDTLAAANAVLRMRRTRSIPSTQQLPPDWKRAAATDRCAKCGYPLSEHGYNGACYGVCGEFVSSVTSTHQEGGK